MQVETVLIYIGSGTLAVSLIFSCYYLAFKLKSTPAKPSHPCETFHDLVLISRQDSAQMSLFGTASAQMTLVLKICNRCATHVVFTYPGIWSLEDLAKKESDISTLERMAR